MKGSNWDGPATGRGELEALELIAKLLEKAPSGQVWSGDDTAVVPCGSGSLLLTVDTVVEGIHADLGLVGMDDFGWRSVTTAASDIAAMGGEADQVLVSVAGPPTTDLRSLYRGIAQAAASIEAAVVGGELSGAPVIVVTVTVVGRVPGDGEPVLRSGAKPGDYVFVTGPLGGAAAGLRFLKSAGPGDPEPASGIVDRHRRPVARLAQGSAARSAGARAMIDLSDGFAADLRKLAGSSGVGIELDSVPVADRGERRGRDLRWGRLRASVLRTGSRGRCSERSPNGGLEAPAMIGRCTAEAREVRLRGVELRRCGYEHPWVIPTTTGG